MQNQTRYMEQKQKCIAGFIAFGLERNSDLYYADPVHGLRRRDGASHRSAFWAGFDGAKRHIQPQSAAAWCYEAGKRFRKIAPQWAIDAKPSRN